MRVHHLAVTPHSGSPIALVEQMNKHTDDNHILFVLREKERDGRSFPRSGPLEGDECFRDGDFYFLHGNGPLMVSQGVKPRVIPGGAPHAWIVYEPYWMWRPWSWGELGEPKIATIPGLRSLLWKRAMPYKTALVPQLVRPSVSDLELLPEEGRTSVVTLFPKNDWVDPVHSKAFSFHEEEISAACEKASGLRFDPIQGKPQDVAIGGLASAALGIDEVVTGGYHRSTLEFLAAGIPVINGIWPWVENELLLAWQSVGLRFQTMPTIRSCARSLRSDVEAALSGKVRTIGRQWMDEVWSPERLIERFYMPLME